MQTRVLWLPARWRCGILNQWQVTLLVATKKNSVVNKQIILLVLSKELVQMGLSVIWAGKYSSKKSFPETLEIM